ncbi:hypothetical protein SAMN05444920_104100 [Nonomuraea solani]|uniref:Uncharacterized protein n=2 Tax=Nonomuraea solani TaxID=1144553 RepID=A0A1H6CL43_9ACTN|nr:hypothetical protein SAMN05444920_104100 [Nonomuraea solani]
MSLRAGDLVEVRSEAEILATLDERGELEGLPFMPEMLKFCGQRLTVHKVAHKLCDTLYKTGLRRMDSAVHLLGARCDGADHGGCQTACSLYWKEAWIKRVDPADLPSDGVPDSRLLPLLEVNTRKPAGEDGSERYSCQATELLRAAPKPLPMADLTQFVTDVRTRNAGLGATLRAVAIGLYNRFQHVTRTRLPKALLINKGRPWGHMTGTVRGRTPVTTLDLRPGELVRIKSKQDILDTVNEDLANRGMNFDAELARYCGQTARVRARVDRCLDERTGRLLEMKTPCIVLEDVVCAGVHSLNCPREFFPFWREIWLERVTDGG